MVLPCEGGSPIKCRCTHVFSTCACMFECDDRDELNYTYQCRRDASVTCYTSVLCTPSVTRLAKSVDR